MQTGSSPALSTRAFALFIALLLLALFGAVIAGIGWALVSLPLLCAAVFAAYRWVYLPYTRVQKVLLRFLSGRTMDELFSLPAALTPEMPQVLQKIGDVLDKQNQLKNAMKQAEFLALQNQINPHFLYNTLEAIRGDALQAGLHNIVDVAEALAIYFRYTISRVNRLVMLSDELRNVESYFAIQKYRYGDRVNMETIYAPEDAFLLDARIPKLTLQPIIENAITHGLEPKVAPGHIQIRFECTESRLLIEISDDGVGVDAEALELLSARLSINSPEFADEEFGRKGGIALVNVNTRIRLLFGEQYGIVLNSTPGLGTDVTVTLPLTFDETEGVRG